MNATTVIGYAYDAAEHCVRHAVAYKRSILCNENADGMTDSEGNPVHPIFCGQGSMNEDGTVNEYGEGDAISCDECNQEENHLHSA